MATSNQLYALAALHKIRRISPYLLRGLPSDFLDYTPNEVDAWLASHAKNNDKLELAKIRIERRLRRLHKTGLPDMPIARRGCWVKNVWVGSVNPTVTKQMMQVDPMWTRSKEEADVCLKFGPAWSQKSCAIDSVLMLMLSMQVGRLRIDQLSLGFLSQLSDLQRAFLDFSQNFWKPETQGSTPVAEMSKFRDRAHQLYLDERNKDQENPKNLLKTNSPQSLNTIVDFAFRNVPQVTWLEITADVCDECSEFPIESISKVENSQKCIMELYSPVLSKRLENLQSDEINYPIDSVEALVGAHFEYSGKPPTNEKCQFCEKGRCGRATLVVGKMPPRLIVDPDVDVLEKDRCKFDDLEFGYFRIGGDGPATYTKAYYRLAAIVQCDNAGEGHFMLLTIFGRSSWWSFDSIRDRQMWQERGLLHENLRQLGWPKPRANNSNTDRDKRPIALLVYDQVFD